MELDPNAGAVCDVVGKIGHEGTAALATLSMAWATCWGAKWWTMCPAPSTICSTLSLISPARRLELRLKTILSPSPAMMHRQG